MTADIVPASAALSEAMAAIHLACFGAASWSSASIATLFESKLVFGYVAGRGGMVIARAVADDAEILTIGVVPEVRRQGIAGALLTLAADEAVLRGTSALFLEVAANNEAALSLYCNAGFERTGLRRGYYGTGTDAVLLMRPLCE